MKYTQRTLVLLLVAVLCGASCSKENLSVEDIEAQAYADLQAQIRETVVDEDRQAEVLQLADELISDYEALRITLQERRNAIRRVNADYDSTRDDFAAALSEFDRDLPELRRKVSSSRHNFINATTDVEWDELAKIDSKTMKLLASVLKSI